MKIFLNATDIQRMSERIENGQTGDIVVLTRLIETRQNFWLSIGQGVKQIQDDCEAGRA